MPSNLKVNGNDLDNIIVPKTAIYPKFSRKIPYISGYSTAIPTFSRFQYYFNKFDIGVNDFDSVVARSDNTDSYLFLKKDGTLWAIGSGTDGVLGLGNSNTQTILTQVGTLNNWKQVSMKQSHVAAVKTDGTLWTWGKNDLGQLGNGNTTTFVSPIQIGSSTDWSYVDAGVGRTFAIKTDGTLWAWGGNYYTQLGIGQYGSAYNKSSPVQVGSATNWKQVTSGTNHTIAIKTDGTLWGWGYNLNGVLATGVVTWYSIPIQLGSDTNWKQISTGTQDNFAIKTNGTLWGWGYNGNGQLGLGHSNVVPTITQIGTATNWKYAIQSSSNSGAVIKEDGTVWTCGLNDYGQLGFGTPSTGGVSTISNPVIYNSNVSNVAIGRLTSIILNVE